MDFAIARKIGERNKADPMTRGESVNFLKERPGIGGGQTVICDASLLSSVARSSKYEDWLKAQEAKLHRTQQAQDRRALAVKMALTRPFHDGSLNSDELRGSISVRNGQIFHFDDEGKVVAVPDVSCDIDEALLDYTTDSVVADEKARKATILEEKRLRSDKRFDQMANRDKARRSEFDDSRQVLG